MHAEEEGRGRRPNGSECWTICRAVEVVEETDSLLQCHFPATTIQPHHHVIRCSAINYSPTYCVVVQNRFSGMEQENDRVSIFCLPGHTVHTIGCI